MSDNKPTSGPWIVYQPTYSSQLQIRDEAGELIIAAVPEKGDKLRCRADAELLAAAPSLLDALIIALPYVESAEDDQTYKAGAVAIIVRQMRAAISKAEGMA